MLYSAITQLKRLFTKLNNPGVFYFCLVLLSLLFPLFINYILLVYLCYTRVDG